MTDHRHESSDPTGPGASASIGHMPRVGSDFASYRIQGVLGRGGMSVVFRADNMRLGNEVALKVLSAELSENDAFRERFVRESRLAASINHPNIIPIYDAGEEDGLLYIAMRYVAGADLKTLIRQEGPLSLRRTADLISQVARGLSVAHQRGLIHRDIKPANILTERAGADGETVDHAYLADFGLMKHQVSRSGLTDTGQFLGTVDYVAPEQVEGRQTDQRSDVYSLGCVLYECLTGSVPYPRDSDVAVLFAHVQDTVPRITDLRPDLTSAIDEIGARAMAKRPEHRYANATDISRDLTEAVGAFRYSHDRPSRAITDPTPREASSYGATPEVVPVPERRGGPGAARPAAGRLGPWPWRPGEAAARPPVGARDRARRRPGGCTRRDRVPARERGRLGAERKPRDDRLARRDDRTAHRRHGHDNADRSRPGERSQARDAEEPADPVHERPTGGPGARVAQLLGALELRDHVRRLDVPGHRRRAGRLQDPARVTGDPDQHERLHQAQLERRAGVDASDRVAGRATSRAISTPTATP